MRLPAARRTPDAAVMRSRLSIFRKAEWSILQRWRERQLRLVAVDKNVVNPI
jgi:hypothetical protein